MYRNFSDKAREDLKGYVDDVAPSGFLETIKDGFSDFCSVFSSWFNRMNINDYLDDLSGYHSKIIDMYNYSKKQIDKIFDAVIETDSTYKGYIEHQVENASNIRALIEVMADCIDPNAGNLSADYKGYSILSDASERLSDSRSTVSEDVEESMLGVEAAGSEMSVDPVNLSTGNFVYDHEDLFIGGEIPISFHRYYNSKDKRCGSLGKCFLHNYDIAIEERTDDEIGVRLTDGQFHHFEKTTEGKYIGKTIAIEDLEKTEAGYTLVTPGKERKYFNRDGKIIRQENWLGRGITFLYNENGLLTAAITDSDSKLIYTYDENNLLDSVTDHTGRKVGLYYNNRQLIKAVMASGAVYTYEYGTNGRITESVNANATVAVVNKYDNNCRVTEQVFSDGTTMLFNYDDENNTVTSTERNGTKTIYVHDDKYRNTETIYADGTKERYIYNEKNQCIRYIDRLGNIQRMSYDNRGNLTQKIDAIKRRYNMTYDEFNNLICLSVNGKRKFKNYYDKNGKLIYVKDAMGFGISYNRDEKGRVVELVYEDGCKAYVNYDSKGNVVKVKKANNGEITYEYNDLNQVSKIIDANGNISSFEYDLEGNVIRETNAIGDCKQYIYSLDGKLTEIVDYNGEHTYREYNNLNLLEKFIDQKGFVTSLEYDSMWNIRKMLLPNGSTKTYEYDVDNRLSKTCDEVGMITNIKYDANGNCISEIVEDSETRFLRDPMGRLVQVINPDGGFIKYQYDDDDNLIYIHDSLENEVYLDYNANGQLIQERDSLGEIRKYEYDLLGNVISVEDEFGNKTEYVYVNGSDKIQSIFYPDGKCETYEYDLNENLTKYVDKVGNAFSYTYDMLNRMTEEYYNSNMVRKLVYDQVGNVIRKEDQDANITEYYYSPKNELIKVIDPLGCIAEYTYDEMGAITGYRQYSKDKKQVVTNTYKRNKNGQVVGIVDAAGIEESYRYNTKGQLVEKIDKEGYITKYGYSKQGDVNYIEYADGRKSSLFYNEHRHLEKIQDWNGETTIINDTIGRATSVCFPNGENVSYTYNSAGKRTSIKYPDGHVVKYKYDNLMRLMAICDGDDTFEYMYDDNGMLSKKVLPNGLWTEYGYSTNALLTSIVNKDSNGILDEMLLSYNEFGRRMSLIKRSGESTDGLYQYEYDESGRLTSVLHNGNDLRNYEYDSFGNRIRTYENGIVTTYLYNENHQLSEKITGKVSEKYTYDKRGNLIQKLLSDGRAFNYSYGASNRLESVSNPEGIRREYHYNGLGHRIAESTISVANKKQNNAFVIDMTKQYDNLLQMNALDRNYVFSWDDNIAALSINGEKKYLFHDQNGSSIRLVDQIGKTIEKYGYTEFGEDEYDVDGLLNPFGFTGYRRDDIAGTYYAQAREYMPTVARFAARDFVKGRQDDISSLNEYVYCKDDPNNYQDRNGMFVLTTLAIIGVGAAVGAVTSAGVNAATQGIKMATGKQDSFEWGSLLGSTVEGAIVGGVSAIPGVGLVGTVVGGAVGSAANSAISQGIDDKCVDMGKVAEDAIVGGVTSGVFYGLGKLKDVVKTKVFKIEPKATGPSTKDLYKETRDDIVAQKAKMEGAIKATGRTSPHRKRQYEQMLKERNGLLKKYAIESLKDELDPKKLTKKALYTVFGIKTTKSLFEDVVKRVFPLYDDETNIIQHFDDYFGTLYGKLTGHCPLLA